jgi:hypothetical protein
MLQLQKNHANISLLHCTNFYLFRSNIGETGMMFCPSYPHSPPTTALREIWSYDTEHLSKIFCVSSFLLVFVAPLLFVEKKEANFKVEGLE